MTPKQRLQVRQAETRARLGEISALEGDTYTDAAKTEEGQLIAEMRSLDQRLLAADLASDGTEPQVISTAASDEDPDRVELRSRAKVGNFVLAAIQGRQLAGAEAELVQELGLTAGQVPLELFEPTPEMRAKAAEFRAISPAPSSGLGVNVEPIHPAIFARSVLPPPRCGHAHDPERHIQHHDGVRFIVGGGAGQGHRHRRDRCDADPRDHRPAPGQRPPRTQPGRHPADRCRQLREPS